MTADRAGGQQTMDPISANEEDDGPHQISVVCDVPQADVDSQVIERLLRVTLEHHDCAGASVSVAIVDDATMAVLHERHLGIPGPTDVLTYDLRDADTGDLEGEIVIDYDTAVREGAARKHSPAHEVLLYAVHGLLHLLGYDDHEPSEAEAMHACEDEMLAAIGIGPVYRRSS